MMRYGITAVLLLTSLTACERRAQYLRDQREGGDAQIVSLSVRSDPPGATVKVDRMERTWTTPCDIADFSIQRGKHEVHVTLDGYEPALAKVSYDGYDPAWVQLKLVPRRSVARPAEEPKPAKPAPPAPALVEVPAAKPEPKPAPVKAERVPGGTRLKIVNNGGKLRILARTVVMDPEKPGEVFLPDCPPEKAVVEFVDPKTDAVINSVEISRVALPAAPPLPKDPVAKDPPPVKDPPVPVEADRVGEVKVVSKTYGVFVKLDPGLSLQPGEEILVFRDGKEIARTKILKITKSDDNYPDGAAQVQKDGSIKKGDEVRRLKP